MGHLQEAGVDEFEQLINKLYNIVAPEVKQGLEKLAHSVLYLFDGKQQGAASNQSKQEYQQGNISMKDLVKQDKEIDAAEISTDRYALLKKEFDKSGIPYNISPVQTQDGSKAFRIVFPTKYSKHVSNALNDFAKHAQKEAAKAQKHRSIISDLKDKSAEVSRQTFDAVRNKVTDISR